MQFPAGVTNESKPGECTVATISTSKMLGHMVDGCVAELTYAFCDFASWKAAHI